MVTPRTLYRAKLISMQQPNRRREPRSAYNRTYSISWRDETAVTHSAQVQGTDLSDSGIGVRCPIEIRRGTAVCIEGQTGDPAIHGVVCHATRRGTGYIIGLKLGEATKKSPSMLRGGQTSDHYEFLQISPKAQVETIHRVYRFLAARYHPDNPDSGDPEKFLVLNRAYEVLSNPDSRARYDETLKGKATQTRALFDSVDFLDGVEGEVNRRLGVLSLLYRKCRENVNNRHVSLAELETQMGCPREYLDFTIWYLRSKKYVTQEDNGELALTASGVDYIEENYANIPLLHRLLTAGAPSGADSRTVTTQAGPVCATEPHILHEGAVLTEVGA